MLIFDDDNLAFTAVVRLEVAVEALFQIRALQRGVVVPLRLEIGKERGVQQQKAWMRQFMLLAIFEQADRNGGMRDRAQPLAPTASRFAIDDEITRILVVMDAPYSRKIPTLEDLLDLQRELVGDDLRKSNRNLGLLGRPGCHVIQTRAACLKLFQPIEHG